MKLVIAAALLLPLAAWASVRRVEQLELANATGALPDILPEPSFLETIGIMVMKLTRGERNNNPGNLRQSPTNWQGEVQGGDAAFESFASPQMGIRATARTLRNYQLQHGLRSVRALVTRWAPPTENNTDAYVRAVAAELGVSPDQAINLLDDGMLERLTAAIIRHENGRVIYSQADIAAAVRLA